MNIDKEMQDGRGFVQWFVLHAISRPDQSRPTLIDRVIKAAEFNNPGTRNELRMQLNGVEVDPVVCLKAMEADYDRQVKIAATELLEEKFGNTVELLHDTAKEAVRELRVKLGLPETKEW